MRVRVQSRERERRGRGLAPLHPPSACKNAEKERENCCPCVAAAPIENERGERGSCGPRAAYNRERLLWPSCCPAPCGSERRPRERKENLEPSVVKRKSCDLPQKWPPLPQITHCRQQVASLSPFFFAVICKKSKRAPCKDTSPRLQDLYYLPFTIGI